MSRIVTSTNNPLLASQWHLGQIFKGDPNRIWSEFSGAGVKVGVYDDGIDKNHIDLRNRYDSSRELVINGQRLDASTGSAVHGTAVAGLIAADANNGAGGVGVAHSAMLTGVNIFSGIGASSGFITAIRGMSSFDVTNNSWGWSSRYVDSAHQSGSFGNLFASAVKNAADVGRGGLGTIVVNAAGNEGGEGRDSNMSNFNAMRQTITVGAIGQDGDVSGYSTRGASVLVSGPSNGGGAGIVTTDVSGSRGYASGDYTSGFGGTSAASPIVSGVVAVMLSANNKLGWRDVQDILAITADHTTPAALTGGVSGRMQSGWTVNKADNVNGGGLHYSNDVGFGRVDALEAVRFAEVWSRFGSAQTSANEQVATVSGTLNRAIADLKSTEFTVNIARAIEVESVSLTLTLSHGNINDLRVELISPEGTRSVVLNAAPGSQSVSGFTWSFTSEALRGELASGNWLVRITDTRAGATGSVASYRLDVYGDAISANDVYHYTSEFGKMLALNAARGTLRDTDGGIDWINASAAIDATIINLNAGALSTIHGRSLTIAAGTVIENAVTGDGNDMLTGNDVANTLLGMRGNDTLEGRGGADRLEGGAGIDTASYLASNLGIDIDLTRASQTGGHAQGDVLVGIENVTGSAHADRISGDGNANMLSGGIGNDTIGGGAGNDYLSGGSGNDILTGGSGSDRLDGSDGIDTASYATSTLGVTVDLQTGMGTGGDAAGDILSGVENLIGSNQADVLRGNSLANRLEGGLGNDALLGFDGLDTLVGGSGNDTLDGGLGNDMLFGGLGDDAFTGGAGNDRFCFDVRGGGNDRILDFQDGRDLIDFRGLGLSFASLAIASTGQAYAVSGVFGTITVSGAERGLLSAADFIFA
jgi:subtilisin-like proprotein convertase family protein